MPLVSGDSHVVPVDRTLWPHAPLLSSRSGSHRWPPDLATPSPSPYEDLLHMPAQIKQVHRNTTQILLDHLNVCIIYITYYTSKSGIWRVISRVACIFMSRRRVQIQLTSEITWPYSTTSVISGLFYTSYSFYINITMKYTHDYATCMPTREKNN